MLANLSSHKAKDCRHGHEQHDTTRVRRVIAPTCLASPSASVLAALTARGRAFARKAYAATCKLTISLIDQETKAPLPGIVQVRDSNPRNRLTPNIRLCLGL